MVEVNIQRTLRSATGQMNLQVDFKLKRGSFTTLYGHSGAGKSSVFRMLAGLMKPNSGRIVVNGTTWFDDQKKINLPPQKRNIGLVFQDYALFPNMTVEENLLFALKKGQSEKKVRELIDVVDLGDLQYHMPKTLSGGQKQRVALARALVQKPDLLLLDEPLSALDHNMSIKLQNYLIQIHQEYELTIIFVSHILAEILKMSSHILLLDQGKIIERGHPIEILTHKSPPGEILLTGDIIHTDIDNGTIEVLIGKNVVRLNVDEMKMSGLHPGDVIQFSPNSFDVDIQVIK